MVELVDTGDLKSPGYCSCAGSSPAPGTRIGRYFYVHCFDLKEIANMES